MSLPVNDNKKATILPVSGTYHRDLGAEPNLLALVVNHVSICLVLSQCANIGAWLEDQIPRDLTWNRLLLQSGAKGHRKCVRRMLLKIATGPNDSDMQTTWPEKKDSPIPSSCGR